MCSGSLIIAVQTCWMLIISQKVTIPPSLYELLLPQVTLISFDNSLYIVSFSLVCRESNACRDQRYKLQTHPQPRRRRRTKMNKEKTKNRFRQATQSAIRYHAFHQWNSQCTHHVDEDGCCHFLLDSTRSRTICDAIGHGDISFSWVNLKISRSMSWLIIFCMLAPFVKIVLVCWW